MKVLLIQDIDGLGLAGETREVADGYGRNYLIPQGFVVLATSGALKNSDLHRRRAVERRQREADEMAALAAAVGQTTLVFQGKAGEKGRLYGSITTADIADQLSETVGQEIDRRKLSLEGPIKQLGTHQATLRLSADAVADFSVVVEPTEDSDVAVEGPVSDEPVLAAEALDTEASAEVVDELDAAELDTEEPAEVVDALDAEELLTEE